MLLAVHELHLQLSIDSAMDGALSMCVNGMHAWDC